MRWNDYYDEQALSQINRDGYPHLWVCNHSHNDDHDHLKLLVCLGKTGDYPSSHYSYAITFIARGFNTRLINEMGKVEWIHRDVWEEWLKLKYDSPLTVDIPHPYMTRVDFTDLPLYLDLPFKCKMFEELLQLFPGVAVKCQGYQYTIKLAEVYYDKSRKSRNGFARLPW